ncbi:MULTISPECIES: stage III sporulation protein AD [Geomicrobium]|uniref:Stage III sporulation protein AD n=1 Tax=Geomicrobium sediminis TaxID=1347788 RepID=A0ABS2PF09_9BACL|nr:MULTISPECIES: stage III sporulation protein AD [Geomicrobium]EZH67724.1 stage III sporulation protein AD [Bacillaceae bacterium JMAK1]MBM7633655.1 stage III sporulation protein AD [Geomicrobium sediminis]GAJ98622.1 stage III sporulation protein AD [Geomicrobium sp. JCM 19055]GAK06533.1 stage III sporulation protein AD [Geomicrobium sp. JCM 19038]
MSIDMIQIVGFGLISAFLAMILKEQKPAFAFLLTLFVGAMIFLFLLDHIVMAFQLVETLATHANINMVYLQTMLKIIGIAYIAEFGAQIARDADQGAIAQKIELAGKVLIVVMAIPIFNVLIETVISLIPG